MPHPDPDAPPADALEFDELCRALPDLLGGPISTSALHLRRESTHVWLPLTWLQLAHDRVRKRQGDHSHRPTSTWSRRRLLVATLNRLDADVEAVLDAEDPRVEVAAIYDGLRAADAEWSRSGGRETPAGCGCRATFWSASIVERDADGTPVWEHCCAWCGSTATEYGETVTKPRD